MNPEITTSAERTASTVEAEPRLTLTELHSLMRDAAALERAQRPIVLAPSATLPVNSAESVPVTAGYAPPRHPGIDVTIPSPPEVGVGWAVLRHRAPTRPGWGLRLAYTGMAATLTGALGAGITDGNGGAVAVAAAGLLATLGGVAQAVNEHGKEA